MTPQLPPARKLDWFLLRLLWVLSPLPLIAGIAEFVWGSAVAGVIFVVMAAVMAAGGYRTRGQRRMPPS